MINVFAARRGHDARLIGTGQGISIETYKEAPSITIRFDEDPETGYAITPGDFVYISAADTEEDALLEEMTAAAIEAKEREIQTLEYISTPNAELKAARIEMLQREIKALEDQGITIEGNN